MKIEDALELLNDTEDDIKPAIETLSDAYDCASTVEVVSDLIANLEEAAEHAEHIGKTLRDLIVKVKRGG